MTRPMTRPVLPAPDRFSNAGKLPRPEEHAEILVVGGGPAGCSAAIEAARAGASVVLVDEHPVPPGLIGMDVPFLFGGRASAAVQTPERLTEQVLAANPLLADALEAGVDVRLSTSVWGAWVNGPGLRALPGPMAGLADAGRSWMMGFDRLIVATGARDLVLSFAGVDTPGVVGARGLHTLLESYDAFTGRRAVVLGSGDLAIATARLVLQRGLEVVALVEAGATTAADVGTLRAQGVEIVTGMTPVSVDAVGGEVAGLILAAVGGGAGRRIVCDTVCLAVGEVPVIELLDVLGAGRTLAPALGGHVPSTEPDGRTSLASVFAAGDCAGLGGDAAGQGVAAARGALRSLGRDAGAPETVPRPQGPDALAYRLEWMRAMLETGGPDAPACLCEDVTRGELLAVQPPRYLGWRSNAMGRRTLRTLAEDGPLDQDQIKRLTRACMGACQARRCREQVALLMALGAGVPPGAIPLAGYRAPVRPLPLGVLADWNESEEMTTNWNVWFGINTQWIPYDDIGTGRELEQLRGGMPY